MKPPFVPECITTPAEMPKLKPRRMPELPLACPAPAEGAVQRYRMPLWRLFEKLGD